MTKPVTYADLDRFLAHAGFTAAQPNPSTVVYSSPSTDAFFAFPPREATQAVDPFHLWSVRTTLVERGIVEEEEVERWLCQVRFPDDCESSTRAPVGGKVARVS